MRNGFFIPSKGSLVKQFGFLRLEFRVVDGARVLCFLQINELLPNGRGLGFRRGAAADAEAEASTEESHGGKTDHCRDQ